MPFNTSMNNDFSDNMINKHSFLDEAVEWIKSNCTVEEIFGYNVLESWALDNGFIKEEYYEHSSYIPK